MPHKSNTETHQSRPSRRGFRTADGMIVIALTATGFALSSSIASETDGFVSWAHLGSTFDWARRVVFEKQTSGRNMASASSEVALRLVLLSAPFLASISLAPIPIQLLQPRLRLRRLALQPGTVAACATVIAMVFVGMIYGTVKFASSKDPDQLAGDAAFALMCLPIFVGFSIVSAWTMLLAAGLWRAEPTWIDRLGRSVATAWIVVGFFTTCRYLVFGFSVHAGVSSLFY